MVDAIAKELILKSLKNTHHIESIYFGGGTPSLLDSKQIQQLFEIVFSHYTVKNDAEITLEANPDDLSDKYIESIKNTPINRWSVGIQSFQEKDLDFMGRAHNAKEAKNCLDKLHQKGFDNYSIDLIYGIPTNTFADLRQNLETAMAYEPNHISTYSLTIEDNTALSHQLNKKIFSEKNEKLFEEEYHLVCDFLREQNYEHYELSNFCKTHKQAVHNTSYWERKPYLGFGPSAHSFDGKNTRSWNLANNMKYIKAIEEGFLPLESEILNNKDIFNEKIMVGLRTEKGCGIADLKKISKPEQYKKLQLTIKKLDYLIVDKGRLKIPEKKWPTSDAIIRDLFITD